MNVPVINLLRTTRDEGEYELLLAKRSKRAAPKPRVTKKQVAAARSKASTKQIEDLDGLIAKIDKPMTKGEIYKLADEGGHGSAYLLRKHWGTVEENLIKIKNRYRKLSNQ